MKPDVMGSSSKNTEWQRTVLGSRFVSDEGRSGRTEHLTEYVLETGRAIHSDKEVMTAFGKIVVNRQRQLVSVTN